MGLTSNWESLDTMFNNHLMKACLAAVFAIGLAACSSSSDNGSAGTTDPMPTQEEQQLAALQQEIADLRAQLGISDDADIGDSITALMAERDRLQKQINDAADAEADAMRDAMVATAAKLYAGIYAPAADATGTEVGDVHAAYNATDDAIVVTMGDGTAANATNLSEDEDTMVAANSGWAGKRYADPAGGDMVEAMVYSNVEAPTMGKKFGGAAANDEFEYALTNGSISVDTSTAGVPARVGLTGVTRTAGTETFKLPDPNPGGATNILVPGSFHGVSGTYSCTPSTPADGCMASVAAMGFTLEGGTWTFMPSNPNARVMESADTAYASYGWWLSKAENDGPFTASAFHDFKGTAETVDIANLVAGTATYVGGAAGKYALSSTTGGTNDAGHFTARATLEAEFGDATDGNTITGTIDNFMGADGMSRDWSVELNETTIGNDGVIAQLLTTATAGATVWSIGDDAAAASGQWSGNLREEGDDGVPEVATGTFYTEFGRAGKMVGAFGANKQ